MHSRQTDDDTLLDIVWAVTKLVLLGIGAMACLQLLENGHGGLMESLISAARAIVTLLLVAAAWIYTN